MEAPLDRLPLFVRANAAVAATESGDGARRTDEPTRALLLFPAVAPPRTSDWIEDDGVSVASAKSVMRCTLDADARARALACRAPGFVPAAVRPRPGVLPAGETRTLAIDAASLEVPVVR